MGHKIYSYMPEQWTVLNSILVILPLRRYQKGGKDNLSNSITAIEFTYMPIIFWD